jgi:hypothetical protein
MRRALALAAVVAALLLAGGPAAAIPSGGASPDTPGTDATTTPKSLQPGQTLSYRVSGFPAGEIVYLKIDDGLFCSQSGVHGACVVAQQRIPASGTVTGSLVLPSDLEAGKHWLRFLASEEVYADDGAYEGTKGYTARGRSDFTVVAAGPSSPGSSGAGSGTQPSAAASPSAVPTATATTGAVPSDTPSAIAGGTLSVSPSAAPVTSGAALPQDTTDTSTGTSTVTTAAAPTVVKVRSVAAADRFPYVGLVGLVVLCLLAALVLVRARRPRG